MLILVSCPRTSSHLIVVLSNNTLTETAVQACAGKEVDAFLDAAATRGFFT